MNSFDDEVFNIVRSKNPNANREEVRKWMNSSDFWANWNNNHSANWVEEFIAILNSSKTSANRSRFFTLVCGILNELSPDFEKKLQVFIDLSFSQSRSLEEVISQNITKDISMRDHLTNITKAYGAMKEIENRFTKDQIFLVNFLRNKFSHPTLHDYMVKIKKSGTFNAQKYAALVKVAPINEDEFFNEIFEACLLEKTNLQNLLSYLKRI